jgi:hypothetical protein
MPMDIDGSLGHVPPNSKRIVAQHKPDAFDHQCRMNALPATAVSDDGIVVVADNEVVPDVQRLGNLC